jgi:hypothetical protein
MFGAAKSWHLPRFRIALCVDHNESLAPRLRRFFDIGHIAAATAVYDGDNEIHSARECPCTQRHIRVSSPK